MAEAAPLGVVITPDGFGRALLDPRAAGVLAGWRDGQLRPVVNRALVLRYLKLLHRLGVGERGIRWWGWWWGSPEKVVVCDQDQPELSGRELCLALASANRVQWLIHGGSKDEPRSVGLGEAIRWVSVVEFGASGPSPEPGASSK
jgi:hypothetical protein